MSVHPAAALRGLAPALDARRPGGAAREPDPGARANTILYAGILASHAAERSRAVPGEAGPPRRRNTAWAELMRKSFGFDVLACRDCGGRRKYVATLFARNGLARALRAHGYPTQALAIRPARAPPVDRELDWI